MGKFAAAVGDWCRKVPEASQAVLQNGAQRLAREIDAELTRMVYDAPPAPSGYIRNGFLRASFVASTATMPRLTRENPGGAFPPNEHMGPIVLVIDGWDGGQTLYLGYTAAYGPFVHVGADGAPPKPWVTIAAQRWPQIVSEEAAKVKQAFGL